MELTGRSMPTAGFILTMRNVNLGIAGAGAIKVGCFILTMRNVNQFKKAGLDAEDMVLY